MEAITVFNALSPCISSFLAAVELCYETAIAAVIVLRGRAEKSNFIDIQHKKREIKKKRRKTPGGKK